MIFVAGFFNPHDSYCIHVDLKAPEEIHKTVQALVNCYASKSETGSIFVHPNPIAVYWGEFSVLDADLKCLREFWRRRINFSAFLNPAASELPILGLGEFRQKIREGNSSVIDSFENPNKNRQNSF